MKTHLMTEGSDPWTACGLLAFEDRYPFSRTKRIPRDFEVTDDPWAPRMCKRCRGTKLWRRWGGEEKST